MKSEPISNYIWLGLSWRYLQDASSGTAIHGVGTVLYNINHVLEELARFELQVTLRAAYDLCSLQTDFESLPSDAVLSEGQAENLNGIMKELQRTLSAEGAGNLSYTVTDKRLEVRKLLNNPQALFAPDVYSSLPPIAQYDFAEAGRCIAFERSTAAAFHILRGTEDVLRKFYCAVVKQDKVDPLLWGRMTESLKKHSNKPPDELLQNLDNIRLSFRNPTQHPEKIYDIQEVQDLFSLCIDVVNRMVKNTAWKNAT